MEYLLASFLAGVLTVLAPCILPLLPVVIGGSASKEMNFKKPLTIIISLAISVFIFTLLLRVSTALLGIPTSVWQVVSGVILIILGIVYLIPAVWDRPAAQLNARANRLLGKAAGKHGVWKDVATGAALGPVFSSCSPTFAFIIAIILPQSFASGVINLAAYTIGLMLILLLTTLLGQRLVVKLRWASNPHGWFRRIVAIIFILLGVAIMFGWDRDFQAFVIEQGWYAPVERLERSFRD